MDLTAFVLITSLIPLIILGLAVRRHQNVHPGLLCIPLGMALMSLEKYLIAHGQSHTILLSMVQLATIASMINGSLCIFKDTSRAQKARELEAQNEAAIPRELRVEAESNTELVDSGKDVRSMSLPC